MFPYFGSKRRVAEDVWRELGNPTHYIEPFAGSLAVLLHRDVPCPLETVNDLDGYIPNFFRAVRDDPDGVVEHCSQILTEADLTARHIWLINDGKQRLERLMADPDFYDVRVAGYWLYGICAWIGRDWCSGRGPWNRDDSGNLIRTNKKEPGVMRTRPHLGYGIGVHRMDDEEIRREIGNLSKRLRHVRICAGNWSRLLTKAALSTGTSVGVFLDPPYGQELRENTLYATDRYGEDLQGKVREWCIANQDDPRVKIVLSGYDGEFDLPGWKVIEWQAQRSYGTSAGESKNSSNRNKERLWVSPD